VVLNLFVGAVGAALICILAPWLVDSVFVIAAEAREKTVLALYLASFVVFVTMIGQVFTSVLQGLQRFDVYAKLFNLNSVGLVAGNLALVLLGYGLNALLAWNLAVSSLTFLLGAFTAFRLLPEFKPVFRIESVQLKRVLGFSAGVIGYQILSNALLLFERGWITRQLGSEMLTYYVVPMMLGVYLHSFVSSLLLVVFPLTSSLKNKKERLKRLYLKATKAVSVPTVFLAVSLISQSRMFLTLWMGADFAAETWLLLVLHALNSGFLALQIV
jgi:O-antigen/teichoic acid export membrane protein